MMPYFKFDYFGADTGLVFAFIIGIGFGFFLERAGFGTAKKLAAQFYFKDLTVFKVMFTAIVTAMLGVLGGLVIFGFIGIFIGPLLLSLLVTFANIYINENKNLS